MKNSGLEGVGVDSFELVLSWQETNIRLKMKINGRILDIRLCIKLWLILPKKSVFLQIFTDKFSL